MGSELVNGSTSHFSYGEIFRKTCPEYMAIGMSYEEFWEKDVDIVKAYREADRIRRKRKDWDLWLQGRYFYDALCAVSPILHAFAKNGTEPEPYPEEPYPRDKKDIKRMQDKIIKENAEGFRALVALKNEERRCNNGRRSDN